MLIEPDDLAPFPDIPAEALGMLTELEKEYGVDDAVQDEPDEMSDEQPAILAVKQLGIGFLVHT
jgi:hypothetical protein